MSIEFRVGATLLDPERVKMATGSFPGGVAGLPSAAFNGEVSVAGLQIEDPEGDLLLAGLHAFTVDETDCDLPRIFTGWLYGKTISRGPYRTGAGRVWNCDIVDQNFAFGLKVFRASSAKRPAETDIARMAFMVDSAPMAATPVHANSFANFTDNPINFGDADYVTQYPVELAASVAGTSGKNFYAYWDETEEEISLYYDLVTEQARVSSLAISNVIADKDADTFYPTVDAEMNRTPEQVASGMLFGYRGAYVYRQRAETITDYIDRDVVYRTDRVGIEATAIALADAMLIERSVEKDTITCTIRVPSSRVNHAHAGMWIPCRFTHLPGLEAGGGVSLPIIRRNVIPVPGRRDQYDLQLELSTKAPERGPGGGDPGVFPHDPPPDAGHYWEGSFSVSDPDEDTGGPTVEFIPGLYTFTITITEVDGDPDGNAPYSSYAWIGDPAGDGSKTWLKVGATYSPGGDTTIFAGTILIAADFGVTETGVRVENTLNRSVDDGFVYSMWGGSAGLGPGHPGNHTDISWVFDLVGEETEEVPPPAGVWVNAETPFLTDPGPPVEYQTHWPYADGAIRITVDDIDQTAALTESDPATGTFTLAFTPTSTERVLVWYQAR